MKSRTARNRKLQSRSEGLGAKVWLAPMTSLYLPPEPGGPEKTKISVRLDPEQAKDLHRLAEIWSEASGRTWTGATLAEEFIAVGLREAWLRAGGRPSALPDVDVKGRSVTVHWTREEITAAVRHIEGERKKKNLCPHCGREVT
jgi:hypothetical protein